MPKLQGLSIDDVTKTLHGFQYTSVSIDKLGAGATEYTITHIVADNTGSVSSFKNELEQMLATVVDSCKKSPRALNLLHRATSFHSSFSGVQIEELHGFSLLNSLNSQQYIGAMHPGGGTPLNDATLEAVDAMYTFAQELYKQKFLCNGILFILTDGEENTSQKCLDPQVIKKTLERAKQEGVLESLRTILIGVNDSDQRLKQALESFRQEAGLDEYVSIGDATPGRLAKLAQFVSQSVSSQSQALGSGGPSQPVSFKF